MKSAYRIKRTTEHKGQTSTETAYYISSLDAAPNHILEIVREHWQIEAMHYMLDVDFGEDACRLMTPNAHQTLNIMRKHAIAAQKDYIAKIPKKTKPTVKNHMLRTLLSDSTIRDVICNLL